MARSVSPVQNNVSRHFSGTGEDVTLQEPEVRRVRRILVFTTSMMLFALLLVAGGAGLRTADAQDSGANAQTSEKEDAAPPDLPVEAWALVDADSGRYLAGENPNKRLPIASTTKIMVALVALDENVDLNEEVTVSQNAASYAGFTYSNIGLFAGDKVSVRELLLAALVPSATDADYALAEHLGDGRVKSFVEQMNDKAKEMGLENTHFENPAGLDSPDHYSSARDLAGITDAAMEYPVFREMVSTTDASITTQDRKIEFFNTNDLLNTYSPATGVKTGTTSEAGPSLVSSAKSGGESYIAVVLDAASDERRFTASETALEYGFDNYEYRPLVQRGKSYEKVSLPYRPDETANLTAKKKLVGLVGPGTEVERRISGPGSPPPDAAAGEKLGEVRLFIDGERAGKTALVTKEGYEEASLWRKSRYTAGNLFGRASKFVKGLLN